MSRSRIPKFTREIYALRPDVQSELSPVDQIVQHVDKKTRKLPFVLHTGVPDGILLSQSGRILVKDVPIEGETFLTVQHGFSPEDASTAFALVARGLYERVSSPLVDPANLISSSGYRPEGIPEHVEAELAMILGERESTPLAMGYLMLSTMDHYADGFPEYSPNRELWLSPALQALSSLGQPDITVEQ